jgi:hypothetical protein
LSDNSFQGKGDAARLVRPIFLKQMEGFDLTDHQSYKTSQQWIKKMIPGSLTLLFREFNFVVTNYCFGSMSAKKNSGCAFGFSLDKGKGATTGSSHFYLRKAHKNFSFRVKDRSVSNDISNVSEFRKHFGAICLPIILVN